MSEQNGTSLAGSGRPSSALRSDLTRPAKGGERASSTGRSSTVSSSLPRASGASSQQASGVRAGRAHSGTAAGSYTGRASLGSAAGSTSVLSSSTAAAAGGASSAGLYAVSGRQSSTAAAAAAAAVAAATPKVEAHTPVPPAVARFTSNPVFNDEAPSLTPSVNTRAYSASLSPQLDELSQQKAAEYAAAHRPSATAPGPAAAAAAVNGADFRGARMVKQSSSSAVVPLKPPEPQHYLRTTGDLFNPPDQGPQVGHSVEGG